MQSGTRTKLPPPKRLNFPPQLTTAEALGIEIPDNSPSPTRRSNEATRVCQPGPLDPPFGPAISGGMGRFSLHAPHEPIIGGLSHSQGSRFHGDKEICLGLPARRAVAPTAPPRSQGQS